MAVAGGMTREQTLRAINNVILTPGARKEHTRSDGVEK